MSGHSKWATTKHKKAVIDARRAKSFAKLIKNIEVAAKLGGADLNGNPTLYDAVQKAKKTSVPNDNIDRAIKRGAGIGGEAVEYQNITYEAYGPNGVALMIEVLTDNKNRAAAEVRTGLNRNGGTLADPGSVAYNFTRKGVIVVSGEGTTEDDVMMAVLEAGALGAGAVPGGGGRAVRRRARHRSDPRGSGSGPPPVRRLLRPAAAAPRPRAGRAHPARGAPRAVLSPRRGSRTPESWSGRRR